jgi:putative cardiolipin synthase
LVLFSFLVLTGCASIEWGGERPVSEAIPATADTRLGRDLAPLVAARAGESGVYSLGSGLDAFVARLALADAAERALDVQYYLFHDDTTGRLLAAYLLAAADRGVRVRLLVDDMDMGGRDAGLVAIDAHPNIEIRLFNPFPSRGLRLLNFLTHFGTVTRRMHNKSFTVDNQVTVVGGRNIGDEYFAASAGVNFGDMDVMAVGPIVQEVSRAFDRYWNSELAVPVQALGVEEPPGMLEQARVHLAEAVEALPGSEYGRRLQASDLVRRLDERALAFAWGQARLLYDLPEKVRTDPEDRSTHLGPELKTLLRDVEDEVFLVSPYFVPGESGTELLIGLVAQGRRVTVLTNSLAATDVPAVHAGYSRYRRALIEAGVELFEMRPSAAGARSEPRRFGESQASLHAKTLVFDRRHVLVGSMNLDPRSALLNTEMGILIDTPELAGEIADWRDRELADVAWRVELEPADPSNDGPQRLVWIGRDAGREVRLAGPDPESSLWARFQAGFLRLLPIERQL